MNHPHLMGKNLNKKQIFGKEKNSNFRHNTSARLSTGEDQALYSYPFGMEDDYKDFKVKFRKILFFENFDLGNLGFIKST
jgi:hypothetical protein